MWGLIERAQAAAKAAGYEYFMWNGWIYPTDFRYMSGGFRDLEARALVFPSLGFPEVPEESSGGVTISVARGPARPYSVVMTQPTYYTGHVRWEREGKEVQIDVLASDFVEAVRKVEERLAADFKPGGVVVLVEPWHAGVGR